MVLPPSTGVRCRSVLASCSQAWARVGEAEEVLLPFVIHAPTDAFPLHVLVGGGWLVVVTALTARRGRRRGG